MKTDIIYNLDVFDFLDSKVDNSSIDLAVVDPPYNMKKAEWDTFKNHDDFLNFTFRWIDSLLFKLKKNASLYIFNTPFNSAFILEYLVKKGLVFQNWITWDKRDGMGPSKRKYANGQETILFFTMSKYHTFNYNNIRVPYDSEERIKHASKKGILKNGKRWFPNPNGKLCSEVWHFSSARHKNKVNGKVVKMPHITPKPLDMIERIVAASSNQGDLVLDCFMGIGTTAIAAKKLNRHFIGTEINKTYLDISSKKLNKQFVSVDTSQTAKEITYDKLPLFG